MSAGNNTGRELRTVPGPNGSSFLEVWDTDERGKLSALVLSCCVESGEDPAEAVAGLLAEFLHPFGAAWESPEQYGRELDAVKWLADFYDVQTSSDAPAHWVVKLDDLGEPDAGPADYWSNSDGWTFYIENADHFTDAEKQTFDLPAGGVWVRMEGEPE